MMRSVAPRELIREAVGMLEDAHSKIFEGSARELHGLATDGCLPGAFGAGDLMCDETANARSRAASSSIHLCMAAALALLRIVCLLIEPPLVLSCKERARLCKDLAANTKVAGQSAYRAALLLADPQSGDDPAPGVMPTQWGPQGPHPEKTRSRFHLHWSRLRAENIRASEFIEFLRPLADLDGIVVSYTYRDEDKDEGVSVRPNDSAESPKDADLGDPQARA